MDIVAWIGLSQALFSGIITLSKDGKSISDRLLSAWLFLLAIEFLTFGLESELFPDFILLTNSFLLFNPALYLYTRSLIEPGFKLKWEQLFHLFPYIAFKLLAWLIKEPQSLENFFDNNNTLWYRLLFASSGIVSWGVYLSMTSIIITRHRSRLKQEFSSIDLFKRVGWIHFVVIIYILYSITVLIWGLFSVIVFDTRTITIFNYSMLLFFIYILGFYGLKQRDIFTSSMKTANKNQDKTTHLQLSKQAASIIEKTLIDYVEKEKPYINPEFNMTVLSENLSIPKHHITEVLNHSIGKNFFQFVNEYRIKEVKEKVVDPKNNFSIEAIGYECGFNSKSTFFSVFKSITGITPKEFQNRNIKDNKLSY